MTTTVTNPKITWGPRIDFHQLPNLYAPQMVEPYTPPPPGIDDLGISSTDTFMIPNVGEFKVDFQGYVRAARSHPSTTQ